MAQARPKRVTRSSLNGTTLGEVLGTIGPPCHKVNTKPCSLNLKDNPRSFSARFPMLTLPRGCSTRGRLDISSTNRTPLVSSIPSLGQGTHCNCDQFLRACAPYGVRSRILAWCGHGTSNMGSFPLRSVTSTTPHAATRRVRANRTAMPRTT